MVRQFLHLHLVTAIVLAASPVWSDDAASPQAAFQKIHAEWKKVDAQLTDLSRSYNSSRDRAERDAIRAEYLPLVRQSKTLLPKLREAALAVLETGKLDDEAEQVLIGLVAYDYRSDDYESALQLTQKLLDAKCDNPALYGIAGMAAYGNDDFDTAEKYLTIAQKADKLGEEGKQILASLPEEKKLWAAEKKIRDKEAADDDLPRVKLETSKGTIVVELFENQAPNTVANFISLVEKKFYDGVVFHRVIGGFMAQGGDPTGTGSGGPGYHIECECYRDDARNHFRGTLSMAHAGRDTGGSQFFLTFRPTPHLDGRHTAFGRVIEGFDVLPKLERRSPGPGAAEPDKIIKAEVIRKRDHKYQPKTMPE